MQSVRRSIVRSLTRRPLTAAHIARIHQSTIPLRYTTPTRSFAVTAKESVEASSSNSDASTVDPDLLYTRYTLATASEAETVAPLTVQLHKSRGLSDIYRHLSVKRRHGDHIQVSVDPSSRLCNDSYLELTLPFASSEEYRSVYRLFNSDNVRIGKIFEDMDALSGDIAYLHAGGVSTLEHLTIVTAALDRVMFDAPLNVEHNLRLQGNVTHVGSSSMEIRIDLIGENPTDSKDYSIGHAIFAMVARDGKTYAAAKVPPLTPLSTSERRRWEDGVTNKARRSAARTKDLRTQPPTNSEIATIHTLYMSDNNNVTEHEGAPVVQMSAAAYNTTQIMQGQDRNIHGKLFGGTLMRLAYELAWANAYLLSGAIPRAQFLDDVHFLLPVDIGTVVEFKSRVLCTTPATGNMMVYVEALMVDPIKQTRKRTNELYFGFNISNNNNNNNKQQQQALLPFVMPKTYSEAIFYIDGRRREKANFK